MDNRIRTVTQLSVQQICRSNLEKKAVDDDNQVKWNKIVKKQVIHGNFEQVLISYNQMQQDCIFADNFTYPLLLKAAGVLHLNAVGLALHGQTIKTGFCKHSFVETALLNMYSSFRCIDDARKIFESTSSKGLVAGNSMLKAYISCGEMDRAIQLFDIMPDKDILSYNIMVSAYASRGAAKSAQKLFSEMPVRDIVSWNSMIFAYGNSGDVEKARRLFDEMPEQDIVSWNTMLAAYTRNELHYKVLVLFDEMKAEKIEPDHLTIASILSVVTHLALLKKGKEVHMYAQEHNLALNKHVVSSLIEMYAKCGSISSSITVFYKSPVKDIYCWNALISALALHGNASAAFKLLDKMSGKNPMPDDITFIGLLSACSHAGLVEEGCELFKLMQVDYNIVPKVEHYGCMIDLFGRAGFLNDALELIESMPFEPGETMLSALLAACVNNRDVKTGEKVVKLMLDRNEGLSDGEYMMVANLYASCDDWENASKWREKMNSAGIEKVAGCSLVEINGSACKFLAGA